MEEKAQDPFLQVREIYKSFPGVQALENVSLSVQTGEIHGLIGENGAGKSTLVRILSGALNPDKGKIVLGDNAFTSLSPSDAQSNGVATVYQEQELVPALSIAENIYLGDEPRKYFLLNDYQKMFSDADNLIQDYGLERDSAEILEDLPISEQQQVAIIKAAHRDAKILLLDEPTAALTASQIDSLFSLIKELRSQGMGVVYISHNLEEVLDISQRITVLRDGKKVGTFEREEVTKPDLVKHMAGHELQETFTRKKVETGELLLEVKGALKDVSFKVHEKEILGLAGTKGSGARDILRAIGGISNLPGVEMKFRKENYAPKSSQDSVDKGVFFLPEDMRGEGLVLPLSLAKNITLSRIKRTMDRGLIDLEKEESLAKDHVESLEIDTPDVNTAVRYLSGGNQRKALFAKALHADADLLLLEDPTQGVDVNARQEIHELFEELRDQGKSLIILSSDLDELLEVSDRIISLYHREKSGEFDPSKIDRQVLLSSILGEKAGYV